MTEALLTVDDISLNACNFKCFGDEPVGFDLIKPINIIIGRNNSGKSSLLDLVQFVVEPTQFDFDSLGHKGRAPQALLAWDITDQICSKYLSDRNDHIQFSDGNSATFVPLSLARQNLGDARIVAQVNSSQESEQTPTFRAFLDARELKDAYSTYFGTNLCRAATGLWKEFHVQRILADRDVSSEVNDVKIQLQPNGRGLTNLTQRHLNDSKLDRTLIENLLLKDLNEIFYPDASYTRILVQQFGNGNWEVYLEEEKKGLIALSQTGSGLKTVLLVLVNILLAPKLEQTPETLSKFVFCFEELENNLHPAIQRRLFKYLRDVAYRDNCHFFITTHSNVVIDMFSGDDIAQIIHVTHDGECATAKTVETLNDGHSVLEDLDVRASDLLQTNVVVWVEGPSDVIYFNRWIELWKGGELLEGIHYQCLTYGGSVNAHLSFDSSDVVDQLIPALKINRNAIFLADSDKQNEDDDLKLHTARLVDEIDTIDGISWITKGKEVENYIPIETLKIILDNEGIKGPTLYKSVLEFIKGNKGNKTEPNKVRLAHQVAESLTREALSETLDLAEKLDQVTAKISEWNRLDEESLTSAAE